jgi:multicomponent Na+:H+ antiporter subunit G
MIEWIRFAIAAILMIMALCSFIAAVTGAYRFGFVMNRMHAAGIGDTMAFFFVVAGIAVSSGTFMDVLKLFMLVFFLWVTSPVNSHFLAQLEYYTNHSLDEEMERRDKHGPDGNL